MTSGEIATTRDVGRARSEEAQVNRWHLLPSADDLTLYGWRRDQTECWKQSSLALQLPLLDLLPNLQLSIRALERGALQRDSKSIPDESAVPRDVVITGRSGARDTVSGITPLAGESLIQLLKRLHPDLPESQLPHEVRQILKYNRDYGNDLGDGTSLDSSATVYLTSVKYLDNLGHIAKVKCPTGKAITYDRSANGSLRCYEIRSRQGAIIETGALVAPGLWSVNRNGRTEWLPAAVVDKYGDLILTDSYGNKRTHLTRGDEVSTIYNDTRPQFCRTVRDGADIARFVYDYRQGDVRLFAIYPNDPGRRILLDEYSDRGQSSRLKLARGETINESSSGQAARIGDQPVKPPAIDGDDRTGEMSRRIVESARRLLGRSVKDFRSYDRRHKIYQAPTNLGCARMASQVLKEAGLDEGIIDVSVRRLEAKLKKRGFIQIDEADMKPGDIIIATSKGKGHTGIYAGNGRVLHNSSRRGYFAEDSYSAVFSRFSRRVIYRCAN